MIFLKWLRRELAVDAQQIVNKRDPVELSACGSIGASKLQEEVEIVEIQNFFVGKENRAHIKDYTYDGIKLLLPPYPSADPGKIE